MDEGIILVMDVQEWYRVADPLPPMSLVAIRWSAPRACGINSLPRSKTPSMSNAMAPVEGELEGAEDRCRTDDSRLSTALRSRDGILWR